MKFIEIIWDTLRNHYSWLWDTRRNILVKIRHLDTWLDTILLAKDFLNQNYSSKVLQHDILYENSMVDYGYYH